MELLLQHDVSQRLRHLSNVPLTTVHSMSLVVLPPFPKSIVHTLMD